MIGEGEVGSDDEFAACANGGGGLANSEDFEGRLRSGFQPWFDAGGDGEDFEGAAEVEDFDVVIDEDADVHGRSGAGEFAVVGDGLRLFAVVEKS